MAIENFQHLSLIFGYLLENHVWKSDDFFEFGWILAIENLKKHLILGLFKFMT